MASLTVRTGTGSHRVALLAGQSVREALDGTDWRVRAACGGTGSCGACVVRLLAGTANRPRLADYQKLTAEERASGLRLACQLYPEGDTEIGLDDPAPPSLWKSISPDSLAPAPGAMPYLTEHIYGLAVDLGTTHIRLSLWDRRKGKRIASRRGPNPQGVFGADVLNRLDAARRSPERAQELARLARNAIIHAVRDILARDVGEVSPMLAEIGEVIIVANTAMLALLTGRGGDALTDPANWQRPVDCAPADPEAWRSQWYLPHARIVLPRPVAGFVGADLLADLVATDLCGGPAGSLLLDVGTNTEIALWDGELLHVTSVPGGPAFEGVGIRNGMAAEMGGICRVRPLEPGGYELETVGDAPARGFCGSGLADAIAVLRASGILKPSGRFAVSPGEQGFLLAPDNARTGLFGSDVDAFQRAKAATAAAMEELLMRAGMAWEDIARLCVCGSFGRTLDLEHAQSVGLLPPVPANRVELHGDATLAGCERALLTDRGLALFSELMGRLNAINLSLVPGYEERYLEHLRLQPVPPIPPFC